MFRFWTAEQIQPDWRRHLWLYETFYTIHPLIQEITRRWITAESNCWLQNTEPVTFKKPWRTFTAAEVILTVFMEKNILELLDE